MNSFTRVVSFSRGFNSLARHNRTRLVHSGQMRSMSSEAQDKKGGINYIAIVGLIAGTLFIGSLLTSAVSLKNSIVETGHDRKAALRHD